LEKIGNKFFRKYIHMSLKVFGYNEDTKELIGSLFQSDVENALYIKMWLLEDGGNGHYIYINSISR